MKKEFKAGDKVYYPSERVQIYTLEGRDRIGYPVVIDIILEPTFTLCGRRYIDDPLPSIFHATPENHELLCKLYGVEFEAPAKPKTPKEVIQAMLDDGWDSVPCYVSDDDEASAIRKRIKVLIDIGSIGSWDFYIPFHNRTGKVIIDYIDGDIVTE